VGFRTNLISKNAAHHMERGELIERVAIVRAGDSGSNYAVAATPKNVYVFALSGLGFGKVSERIAKIPIRKAVVERRSSFLTVGRRGAERPEHVFGTLPGAGPKRLAAYVAERSAGR
jgi:hypothetical protein